MRERVCWWGRWVGCCVGCAGGCGGIVGDDISGRELRGRGMVAELWCECCCGMGGISYWR